MTFIDEHKQQTAFTTSNNILKLAPETQAIQLKIRHTQLAAIKRLCSHCSLLLVHTIIVIVFNNGDIIKWSSKQSSDENSEWL